MSPYARRTAIPAERTRGEIEKMLIKAGADQFQSGWSAGGAIIAFRMHGRFIKIQMPLPLPDKIGATKANKETQRRWRAMLLYVKAKLESIESQIVTFEDAFMSHIVLPDGGTVSAFMRPQIESSYSSGKMPKALPGF